MSGVQLNNAEPRVNEQVDSIEGGTILNLVEEDLRQFHEKKHHAQTASTLAYWLIGILAGSFVLHYISLMCLTDEKTIERVDAAFNTWLPVVSGFVGGAVTYYFTKEKK